MCHFIALRTIKGFKQKHLTKDPIDYYSNLSEVLTGNVITGLFCFAVDITNYSTKIPTGARYIAMIRWSKNDGFVLNAAHSYVGKFQFVKGPDSFPCSYGYEYTAFDFLQCQLQTHTNDKKKHVV